MKPRLIVVSYAACTRYSPRGIRTRTLLTDFARRWDVDLISAPHDGRTAPHNAKHSPVSSLARRAARAVLLDKYEPHARVRCRSLPRAAGAYLVAWPWSPLVYAAKVLAASGTPYVVDVGDPLALTTEVPDLPGLARRRALRLEKVIWENAVGAIVTTRGQAVGLRRLCPSVPILIRPNGTWIATEMPQVDGRSSDSCLRLAHFGSVVPVRLDLCRFLDSLAKSGRWKSVELHQYGLVWGDAFAGLSSARVIIHDPVPWEAAQQEAARLDAAVVVGNRDRTLLPSKAVDYLTLPVPRIAITNPPPRDALAEYIDDKPGWLVIADDTSDVASMVHDHLSRPWSREELAPPASESWEVVAGLISAFVDTCLGRAPTSHPALAFSREGWTGG